VALTIPLVLAMTFAAMHYFDIGLHKISLGALVLALGLLVDDAIIAVEMMAVKMEQGMNRLAAASFAYRSTAFPMLTGTLVTRPASCRSPPRNRVRRIHALDFQVVTIALLLSWIAAVVFIPFLGDALLPERATMASRSRALDLARKRIALLLPAGWRRWSSRLHRWRAAAINDPYDSPFYRKLSGWIGWCVANRRKVIFLTVLLFVVSLALFRFVPQQFFPSSTRLELVVDLELAEGASLTATEAATKRFEEKLKTRKDLVNYVAYVGTGSPRFYLPFDQKLPQSNFAQFVLLTPDVKTREEIRSWVIATLERDFSDLQGRVLRLENGPPVGFPIQFRISGEHVDQVRRIAYEVAAKVRRTRTSTTST
jgi:multidrug efflux pump